MIKVVRRRKEELELATEIRRITQSAGGIKLNLPPRHKARDDGYNPVDDFGKFQPPPRHKFRD